MTQNLTDIGAALDAIKASADAAQVQATADRAAFDSLAAEVRAFLANLPAAGGTLTADQSAQAQAILDGLGATAAVESQQAADEAALQAEVPAPPAA